MVGSVRNRIVAAVVGLLEMELQTLAQVEAEAERSIEMGFGMLVGMAALVG